MNSYRGGFIIDGAGNIVGEGRGDFFNMDLRLGKVWRFGERFGLTTYVDFYNLFDYDNLSFSQRLAISPATGAGTTARPSQPGFGGTGQVSSTFLTPFSLFGPGFGPPVGRPFTTQLGFRFTF
ncbi:MAG: hypothetical protein H0V76_01530 [Blastocatellia bacterium]|nr:hypothetical protein [Blastocatellia bacterium]